MFQTFSVKWKPLLISLAISLGAGGLSALITGNSMKVYKTLNQPPLSPPGAVFPVVWTILFVLMGIAAYLVYKDGSGHGRKTALTFYGIQLLINILWSPIFFRWQAFLFAFFWLVLLWILIVITIVLFYKINKTSAYLMIPYLLWVTFAGYLNWGIYMLN
ncbi:MAG: tryptophan-rich sensory protein [Clostridiales bacterium]|nr:tryptophan-rich sensory protein [Clostridiales bacterium]